MIRKNLYFKVFNCNWRPGLIVVQIENDLKYLPLTPDGLFFSIELKTDNKFSIIERFIDVSRVILNRFQAYVILFRDNYLSSIFNYRKYLY